MADEHEPEGIAQKRHRSEVFVVGFGLGVNGVVIAPGSVVRYPSGDVFGFVVGDPVRLVVDESKNVDPVCAANLGDDTHG